MPFEENVQILREKLEGERQKNKNLQRRLGTKENEIQELQDRIQSYPVIDDIVLDAPVWDTKRRAKGKKRGVACLFISDCHFDEVVNPSEVEFSNKYNRQIATLRLKRAFERAVMMAKDYLQGISYDGITLFLGGDLVSGSIHEEIKETNEYQIMDTIIYWTEQLSAGISLLESEFGIVHVASVVGNHGRTTVKPVMKGRVTSNFDYLIARLLARDFAKSDSVTFQIPVSADCFVSVYDTNYLLTHGDQFRGGGGIAGIFSPLMLGHLKKTRRNSSLGVTYDHMLLGHFHQYITTPYFTVNGSLKGYCEYAYMNNLPYEVPQQAFWICTPEHGTTFHHPVYVQDKEDEGWG